MAYLNGLVSACAPLLGGRAHVVALGQNPIPLPKTELGEEANRLYQAATSARASLEESDRITAQAVQRANDAREALEAEVRRMAAEGGYDSKLEQKLVNERVAAQRFADPNIAAHRRHSGLVAQRAAVEAWERFMRLHLEELLEGELEADAQKVSADLIAADNPDVKRGDFHAAENAYTELRTRVTSLAKFATNREWKLPDSPEPPLPTFRVPDPEPKVVFAFEDDPTMPAPSAV